MDDGIDRACREDLQRPQLLDAIHGGESPFKYSTRSCSSAWWRAASRGLRKNLSTQPVGDGPDGLDGLGRILDVGCDQQLREIAVSDCGTLRGLTQFWERLSMPRFKPLSAKEIEERLAKASACAIIPPSRSQVIDSKDGEMTEWLKVHAWKVLRRIMTECV